MVKRQLARRIHGHNLHIQTLRRQSLLRNQGAIGNRHRPATRVARRAGESGQLLQVGIRYTGLGTQHAHCAGMGIGVLVRMDVPARQSPDTSERCASALHQHHAQHTLHQREHHDIHAGQHMGMRRFTLIHFCTKHFL
ncbi:hypothetical protein D3C72_1383450 [compost metagenome]